MAQVKLAVWKERFRVHLELKGFSQHTVRRYLGELGPLFAYLDSLGIDTLQRVTLEALEGYRARLFYQVGQRGRLTLGSQAAKLSSVKAFFRFLHHDRYLLVDPAAELERPRVPEGLPRAILSEDEMERLLLAPDVTTPLGLRDRAILEVLYASAVRNTELRHLRLEDLDLAQGELRVVDGKGHKSRLVPIGEEAVARLEEYLEHGRPALLASSSETLVFLTVRGRPFHRNNLTKMVRRVARAAGVDKPVTPHALRHACATHMLRRGAGLRHLQVLLGHASPASTQRYTRVELSDLKRTHRRYHPREQGFSE